jgi:hypothetical protein
VHHLLQRSVTQPVTLTLFDGFVSVCFFGDKTEFLNISQMTFVNFVSEIKLEIFHYVW